MKSHLLPRQAFELFRHPCYPEGVIQRLSNEQDDCFFVGIWKLALGNADSQNLVLGFVTLLKFLFGEVFRKVHTLRHQTNLSKHRQHVTWIHWTWQKWIHWTWQCEIYDSMSFYDSHRWVFCHSFETYNHDADDVKPLYDIENNIKVLISGSVWRGWGG